MMVLNITKLIVEDWLSKKKILSKLILFRTNRGKSPALNEAFQSAQGDIVITMDADLQDDPKEIKNFVSKINEGYDFVSGWKVKRKRSNIKNLPFKKYLILLLQKFLELNSTTLIVVFKAYKIRL